MNSDIAYIVENASRGATTHLVIVMQQEMTKELQAMMKIMSVWDGFCKDSRSHDGSQRLIRIEVPVDSVTAFAGLIAKMIRRVYPGTKTLIGGNIGTNPMLPSGRMSKDEIINLFQAAGY